MDPIQSERRRKIRTQALTVGQRIVERLDEHTIITIHGGRAGEVAEIIADVLDPHFDRIDYLETHAVFCFSEDGTPVYIQGTEKGEHEITDHITADVANGMVKRITELMDKIRNVPTPPPTPTQSEGFKHYTALMTQLETADSEGVIRLLHSLGTGELYELRRFLQMQGGKEALIAAIDTEFKNTD